MLRLELRDSDDTVLFVNPMNGVEIGRFDYEYTDSEISHKLTIGKPGMYTTQYVYSSKEDRDTAYEYVLAKVNEYLFPQTDLRDAVQMLIKEG